MTHLGLRRVRRCNQNTRSSHSHLSAATLDSLATFEASREDLEPEPDLEQVDEDGTNESALEWSTASGCSSVTDN